MIHVIGHVGEIPREQFDALDDSAGAAGCYERLRQREADGRWRTNYLYWAGDGTARAAVPVYSCRGKSWPDPAYDPSTWDLPEGMGAEFTAGHALLAGGCADLRSGLHIAAPYRTGPQVRNILVSAARVAAERGYGIAFPYVSPEAQRVLTEAGRGAIIWSVLAREAWLPRVSDPAWERSQKSQVRYVLRRDRRLIEEADVTVNVKPWPTVQIGRAHV